MKNTSGFKHSLYADFLLLYKCIYYEYPIKKTCQLIGKNRSTIYRILHKFVKVIKGIPFKDQKNTATAYI